MIADKDRSGYFGASDTSKIMGNWKTATFERWWLEKLGIVHNSFTTDAMEAGTQYEHKILALVPECTEFDRQIIIGRLRVNLDGNSDDTIYECKTYKTGKEFKPTKAYREQVQVQMYASEYRKAFIVAYPLTEEEYKNFFFDLDGSKISYHRIEYDEAFISLYLVRLAYLTRCLEKGVFPDEAEFQMQCT